MIINPNNATHTLRIIPRFNPSASLFLNIKDTTTNLNVDIAIASYAFTTTGGIEFDFDFEATDETRYQITIKEGDEVIYRGIVIATSQDTQEYQLTNDKYYF
jgi:hypothetical protein